MNHTKRLAFAAACSGMLLFGITIVTLGSIVTELKDKFQLDNLAAGTLFSILPFGLIVGSLLFGPVADRYGYKQLMTVAALGICLGFEGIAYTGDLGLLRFFVFVFGVSGGIINGATNAIVVDVSETHKGSNLAILGVFFGLGALGMPLVLGLLQGVVPSLTVLSMVGWVTLVSGITYQFVEFPPSKHAHGVIRIDWGRLFSPILLLISFFLFFQSALESIITNWTTTYVGAKKIMSERDALFALSVHMVGMILMRVVSGAFLRGMSQSGILLLCLMQVVAGVVLMQYGSDTFIVYVGLFLSGAGLSAGFPVMLGFVGQLFGDISGTAISFVFVIALVGNMLINYVTGLIIEQFGIAQLALICHVCIGVMLLLYYVTIRKLSKNQ